MDDKCTELEKKIQTKGDRDDESGIVEDRLTIPTEELEKLV